jgi:hypothetical protein
MVIPGLSGRILRTAWRFRHVRYKANAVLPEINALRLHCAPLGVRLGILPFAIERAKILPAWRVKMRTLLMLSFAAILAASATGCNTYGTSWTPRCGLFDWMSPRPQQPAQQCCDPCLNAPMVSAPMMSAPVVTEGCGCQ